MVWAWGRKANFGKKILEIVREERRVTAVAAFSDGLFGLVELGVFEISSTPVLRDGRVSGIA